jgi:DNA-binding NtrC family response regulator
VESFAEIKLSMYPWPMHEAAITSVPEPCIMIIDDDLDVIEALSTLLKARYRLISCRSFEETENNLSRDINLVLLDIKMAAKDGLEVFGLLKEKHPHLPISFIQPIREAVKKSRRSNA